MSAAISDAGPSNRLRPKSRTSAQSEISRALAAWAPDILVNAIAPGYIDSPLNAYRKGNPALEAEVLDHTPLHRWGQVEDVAMACVFLASDAAAFIIGHTLFVDGGPSIA